MTPSTCAVGSVPSAATVAGAAVGLAGGCRLAAVAHDEPHGTGHRHTPGREGRAPHHGTLPPPRLVGGPPREVEVGHVVAGQLEQLAQVTQVGGHRPPPVPRSTRGRAARRAARATLGLAVHRVRTRSRARRPPRPRSRSSNQRSTTTARCRGVTASRAASTSRRRSASSPSHWSSRVVGLVRLRGGDLERAPAPRRDRLAVDDAAHEQVGLLLAHARPTAGRAARGHRARRSSATRRSPETR